MNYAFTLLLVALLGFGCSKKDADSEPKAAPTETASAQETVPPPTETDTNGDDSTDDGAEDGQADEAAAVVDVPTAPDFEDEAVEQISDKTLEKDLSAIEKELGE